MSCSGTFFIIKPDAVNRGLVGEVLRRIEAADFAITGLRMLTATRPVVATHYREHRDKPFFAGLIASMAGKTVVIGTAEHAVDPGNSVGMLREIVGPYDPRVPGTIRGDLALDGRENAIHAADSPESAEREADLWFNHEL